MNLSIDPHNPEDVGRVLSIFCNSMTVDLDELVQMLTNDHRTIQQKMFDLMLRCIKHWGNLRGTNGYDERNKFTVCTCYSILFDLYEYGLDEDLRVPYI